MPTIDQDTGVPDGRRDACAVAKGSTDDGDEGGGPAAEAEPTATMRTFRTGKLLGFKKAGWRAGGPFFFGGGELTLGQEVAMPTRATQRYERCDADAEDCYGTCYGSLAIIAELAEGG